MAAAVCATPNPRKSVPNALASMLWFDDTVVSVHWFEGGAYIITARGRFYHLFWDHPTDRFYVVENSISNEYKP